MKEFDNKTNEYPIGGYAPGEYACKCVTCKEIFKGDKRAVQCKDCAVNEREESKTNLEKLQFPELVEEFANYYKEVPLVEKHKQECEYIKEFGCVKDICTCNSNPKKAPFKHECKVISKEEILENRSNAYNFLDFSKQETVEEAIKRLIIEPTLEDMQIFEAGVKWAQKQNNNLYSEKEVFTIIDKVFHMYASDYRQNAKEWFKEYKKK